MKKLLFLFMAVLACNYVIAQQKVYCRNRGNAKICEISSNRGELILGKRMAMQHQCAGWCGLTK